jgi:hypothetical protein
MMTIVDADPQVVVVLAIRDLIVSSVAVASAVAAAGL